MSKDKKKSKVYVVQVGGFDEDPEEVKIMGVFKKLKDALVLRNELFLYNEDPEDFNTHFLESMELENGHDFFNIVEIDLQ